METRQHKGTDKMTKTEAINYIRTEMEMVLDDDYPDKMESRVC